MDSNHGRNWLLLRGLARESAHWGDFVPLLKAQFPTATITTLDLPGTGEFCHQPSPASIPAITEHIRSQAQTRGLLEQPITLLAVSLGAMVAWEWLQRYPDDCRGAVLINTSFASLSPFYQRLRWQNYGKFCALLVQRDIYKRESAIVRLISNRKACYQQTAKEWAAIQTSRPLSIKTAAKQLIAAASYRPILIAPKAPVLLLNSKCDRLVSGNCSEQIQQHCSLELHTHPWGGHDLTLDDGEWVLEQVQIWLKEPTLFLSF
jgi:pimeloyl-ACP methyl ester carboxylesterase